ncbi:MAG: TldD/PmbA family protein, partial [Thermoplasmata archaeon]
MSGLLDPLLRVVQSKATSGLDYVEVRADDVVQTSIELRESAIESVVRKLERGHSARVLVSGRWGFATSDGMRDPGSTIAEASKAARALSGGVSSDIGLSDVKPVRKDVRPRVRDPLDEVDLADKVSYLSSVCQGVVKADPRMTTTKASYMDITGERVLVTSDGAAIRTSVSHAYLMTTSSAKTSGRLVSARDETGTVISGWEHFTDKSPKEAIVQRLAHKAKLQMDGVPCKRGTHPCVLSPRVAGMLAHEALGHLSEADYFSSGAFDGLQGKRVAPESVTMVDSPWIDDGFGNIEVDDEGVLPKSVTLIDKGVLGEQMANREWAKRLGIRPTGNARAENYRVPPIIRMRNTYFEKGDRSLDELLEGMKFGYYCVDVRGGQAEANSSFQVGIQECFEVVKGELGRPVRSLAISGLATDSLSHIDGMGKDLGFESSY